MELKHLSFDLEGLEFKEDGDSRTIEGFASVFNNVDNGNDIVLPGAFAKTLKRKSKIPMLWQHHTSEPIGIFDVMEENERGLLVKGKIIDTTLGMDAYKLLKGGAVTGLSIGYSTKKYEIDQAKGIRKLIEVDLHETSLVTFPMNEKAKVTSVKSNAPDNERDFEELLREAGYPRDAAKIICARGFKALGSQREAEAQCITELTNLFNQFKA